MAILPSGSPENWTLETFFSSSGSLYNNVLNLAAILAGGLAVIYLLIGAFGYFTAFGNEEKANKAKQTITWAIIGIIIIILARVIVNEIISLFLVTPPPIP